MCNITQLFFSTIIFVICCVYSINTIAQNQEKVDSLYKVLVLTKQDSLKVKLYRKLGDLKAYENIDSAISDYKKALFICESDDAKTKTLQYEKQKFILLNNLGMTYFSKRSIAEAFSCYEKALEIAKKLQNKELIAKALNNIGELYRNLGNHSKALNYFLESLNIQKEIKDTSIRMIEGTLLNIGMVYAQTGNYVMGLKYLKDGLEGYTRVHNKKGMVTGMIAIANFYAAFLKLDTALIYQLRVNDLLNEIKDRRLQLQNALLLGYLFEKLNKEGNAIGYYEKALILSQNRGTKGDEIKALIGLSNCYYIIKDMGRALKHAQKSHILCKQLGLQNDEINSLEILSKIYKYNGDYKNALTYYEQYRDLDDSLAGLEAKNRINELEIKYGTEKKENEIVALNNEVLLKEAHVKTRNFIIMAVILSAILILTLFSRYHIKRRLEIVKEKFAIEKQLVEIEQKALLLQMNPHFIYNSLSSIGSLIYENKPQVAIKYLTRFSKLMRLVLEFSLEPFIPLEKELELLECYLELEKFRFDGKFNYTIHTDCTVDKHISILPMLIQPHVENSILHGIRNSSREGKLDISIIAKENSVVCEITDNGIGREQAKGFKQDMSDRRNSTDISNERLDLISKKNNKIFKMNIVDIRDADNKPLGTKVVLDIPASFA